MLTDTFIPTSKSQRASTYKWPSENRLQSVYMDVHSLVYSLFLVVDPSALSRARISCYIWFK